MPVLKDLAYSTVSEKPVWKSLPADGRLPDQATLITTQTHKMFVMHVDKKEEVYTNTK